MDRGERHGRLGRWVRLARSHCVGIGRRRWPTLALAAVAGGLVLAVALVLFPYLSVNHDEGVYLQQAAMLLDGQLFLRPPVEGAFRPWFFIESERGLYSKYSPVPPAVFALGMAVGEPRLALAVVAAVATGLVATLGRWAFDRSTGLAAGALLLAAPMFVMTTASFLPYAPTFALNLAFAAAYVRACRARSVAWAAAAGCASGLAFFARPYTAVLFAAPFAVHALWVLATERRRALRPYAALVAVGLALVGVTLAYNAVMTGHPLLFPYQVFAPLDGLGFGQRRILHHEMEYTPARALEANAYVLWYLATRWGPLGALGTALAGIGVVLSRWAPDRTGAPTRATDGSDGGPAVGSDVAAAAEAADGDPTGTWLSDRQFRVVLLGLVASVAIGNLYFWGNANLLATPTDPRDGLLASHGPFYHFAMLLPLSVFGGHAVARGLRAVRDLDRGDVGWPGLGRLSARQRRALAVAVLAVATPVVGGAAVAAFDQPVERNAAYTQNYEQAYAPVEPRPPADAVVMLPPAYGPWMNHPFQPLRNDPGFDGRTVYALDRSGELTWAVLDAFPDRTPYRFRYRGTWTPDPADEVQPTLRAADRVRTDDLRARTTVGAPAGATSATVAVDAGGETARATRTVEGDVLAVDWRLSREEGLTAGAATVPVDGPTDAELRVIVVGPQGGTLYYELEFLVRPSGDALEVVWPPERQVCVGATVCDDAYVPGTDYPAFVDIETERR